MSIWPMVYYAQKSCIHPHHTQWTIGKPYPPMLTLLGLSSGILITGTLQKLPKVNIKGLILDRRKLDLRQLLWSFCQYSSYLPLSYSCSNPY